MVQKNFLTVWTLILLTMALVLILTLTGCQKQEGTEVISAEEILEETAEQEPAAVENETTETEVSETGAKKDLELKSVLASTIYPEVDELFDLTIKIKNTGTEDIASFDYLIKISKGAVLEKSQYETYDEALPAGEDIRIKKEYYLSETDTYSIEIRIDPGDLIEEKSETNNEETIDITVVEPSGDSGPEPEPSDSCTDTDNGKAYSTKGKCTDQMTYSAGFNDFCLSSTMLMEMYCKDGRCEQEKHACSCVEGACD